MSWPVEHGHLGAPSGAALDERESTPPGAQPLDLHKESSDPRANAPGVCGRWPKHLALRNRTSGEQIRGRCASPNRCEHCAVLGAVENTEVLSIDAMTNAPPAVWLVLTSPNPTLSTRAFYRSREQLQKALKRRFPACEYAALVEFTTGASARSGGRRFAHWNVLLKGVQEADVHLVAEVVAKVWCPRVGGSPKAQYVGTVENAGGVMRYIALHFQKSSQKPPAGWKGHRFLHSRGYFAGPMPAMRAQARESLNFKRAYWKLEQALAAQAPGVEFAPDELHEWASRSVEVAAARSYDLVQLHDELGPVMARPPGRAVRRA